MRGPCPLSDLTRIHTMNTFKLTHETEDHRVRWVYDEDYNPRGSYADDTEEETKAAEDNELENLESGKWVALGAIVQTKCPTCGAWEDKDSLWGIVVPIGEDLTVYAEHSLDLPWLKPA